MRNKIPIVQAFERDKEGNLSFWCPFCAKFHHHGNEQGHVSAHCYLDESPFNATGYKLKKIVYKRKGE